MKSVLDFEKAKRELRPISMVTCYDSTSAKLIARSPIDCILVGDSAAMTMHGLPDTVGATTAMIEAHVQAVRKGAPELFLVADMPFLAHRGSLDCTMGHVARLMRAGANAVKIEGITGSEQTLRHIVESGVPVMGHVGLTPQSVHALGGFKVQGKTDAAGKAVIEQALALERVGVFAIVLECIPAALAKTITQSLKVPTIGIGAGSETDGQVLVWQDLLGLNIEFRPKFSRRFFDGATLFNQALFDFDRSVKDRSFPNRDEEYA